MIKRIVFLLCLITIWSPFQKEVQCQTDAGRKYYKPTFESLEKVNPVPEWFKDAKFGIYVHWGVYSVPAFSNEWYPRSMYIRGSAENRHHTEKYGDISEWPYHNFILGAKDKQGNYVQFAPKLKSEGGNLDPDEWAQLFANAGAKFAGIVAEHHDGFSMWASKVNPWNANDLGPKLDLVSLFSDAIRRHNMKLLLSMHHAYNITGYYEHVPQTDDPKLQILYGQQGKEKNEALWLAKLKEIIDNYNPDIIWQDFNLHRISQPVLLGFLSYYYNRAIDQNKEVVATFKDGLNTKCAILDYERGGPTHLTDIYWLSDDAISPTSWCYTEGLTYYSAKQLLHSLIDKVSKNGNLLLNISPKADGSIPQEQKDILLAIGNWLKKYGEAIYGTRAWDWYGEGPTKMGAGHGVFIAPPEGTPQDIRYTQSKDRKTLYAILLGWDEGQKEVKLALLGADRIDLKNLNSVEIIHGEKKKYLPLAYKQQNDGLVIRLPDEYFVEPAYVIKLSFDGEIPPLDKYVDLNSESKYYLVPAYRDANVTLCSNLLLTKRTKRDGNQWIFERVDKGIYKIENKGNPKKVLTCDRQGKSLIFDVYKGMDNQLWRIELDYHGYYKIRNKKLPDKLLSIEGKGVEGNKAILTSAIDTKLPGWTLIEVCEKVQEPYKNHTIPGIIEAEDYDIGCPGEAYYDRNDVNEGGQYRLQDGVDIEQCSAGGYNVGWISKGEWMAYTVIVEKTGTYQLTVSVASSCDSGKFHMECNDKKITEIIAVPNTKGFQNWDTVKTTVKLRKGKHVIKFVADGDFFNIDKMIFEEERR